MKSLWKCDDKNGGDCFYFRNYFLRMYEYGLNSGDFSLPIDDDSSYGPVNLGIHFPFFQSYTY